MSTQPSAFQGLLVQQLLVARERDNTASHRINDGMAMEIPTTGTVVSSAYEQLRNAAEYSEEHLLLERAIKRFFKRNLFVTKHKVDGLGRELIVELVQAGYLPNGQYGLGIAEQITQTLEIYMKAYADLKHTGVDNETAMNWALASISVEVESMLRPHSQHQAVIFVAYHHFLQALPRDHYDGLPDSEAYDLCLYIAVHQALLKSDLDIVRHDLLMLYQKSPQAVAEFRDFNQQIDRLYRSELTARLKRIIGRYGAPFRILKSMIDDRPDVPELLHNKTEFMEAYRKQITREYAQVHKRLNRGLIKSIIFIIITKVLIGIGIEVPYDKVVHGSVAILPLTINLVFPPLYMASLKLGLNPPASRNARMVEGYIEKLLFETTEMQIQPTERRQRPVGARLLYTVLFFVPILIIVLLLQRLHFNIVQMIIFFTFFSTASFLGFRLSTVIRELELATRQTGLLASLRDTFYLPFILVGQWLSRKYSSVNIVGRFLDVAIELPLKAILRLIRQWIRFLNEKQDELY